MKCGDMTVWRECGIAAAECQSRMRVCVGEGRSIQTPKPLGHLRRYLHFRLFTSFTQTFGRNCK